MFASMFGGPGVASRSGRKATPQVQEAGGSAASTPGKKASKASKSKSKATEQTPFPASSAGLATKKQEMTKKKASQKSPKEKAQQENLASATKKKNQKPVAVADAAAGKGAAAGQGQAAKGAEVVKAAAAANKSGQGVGGKSASGPGDRRKARIKEKKREHKKKMKAIKKAEKAAKNPPKVMPRNPAYEGLTHSGKKKAQKRARRAAWMAKQEEERIARGEPPSDEATTTVKPTKRPLDKSGEQAKQSKKSKKNKFKQHNEENIEANASAAAPVAPSSSLLLSNAAGLGGRFAQRLQGSRFRWLNETLYSSTGAESKKLFEDDPSLMQAYHEGFTAQRAKWPKDPLLDVIHWIKKEVPSQMVIGDFGCGEARIAAALPKRKVHSFDLIKVNERVTPCNLAEVPLKDESLDVVVFCLALMGTDWLKFVQEAHRCLRPNGLVYIVEVESRFENVETVVKSIRGLGFEIVHDKHKGFFVELRFQKVGKGRGGARGAGGAGGGEGPGSGLGACTYRKR